MNEDKKIIQVPAILTSVRTLKDGGLSLGFQTNELSHEEKVVVMEMMQSFGFVLFAANEFAPEEIPKENADLSGKTQSTRIRSVLFVLWKERGSAEQFEDFYRKQTEKFIEYVKSNLEPKV